MARGYYSNAIMSPQGHSYVGNQQQTFVCRLKWLHQRLIPGSHTHIRHGCVTPGTLDCNRANIS